MSQNNRLDEITQMLTDLEVGETLDLFTSEDGDNFMVIERLEGDHYRYETLSETGIGTALQIAYQAVYEGL